MSKWQKENRDKVNAYQRARAKLPHAKEARKRRTCDKDYRKRLKEDVLRHYGDGKCECVKCGFDDVRALSIDHIDGGGNRDRVHSRLSGDRMYRRLRQDGFPEGYQTLCMNCQFIKRYENNEHDFAGEGVDRSKEMKRRRLLAMKSKAKANTDYQGVSRSKDGRFSARIAKDGKSHWLGLFGADEGEVAARNYDYHAITLYGHGNCFLNFPDFDYSGFTPKRQITP